MPRVTRRKMIRQTALLTGNVCLCHNLLADKGRKSDCCYTPDIEPESMTINKDSIIIDLQKSNLLGEVGDAVYVDNEDKSIKIILAHVDNNTYVATSRLCTHGGQALSYIKERGLLQCNSYNHSIFELDGTLWKGPAPGPIKSYTVSLKNQLLKIKI